MTLLPSLIIALQKECKYLFLTNNGTVIFDEGLEDYSGSLPILIIQIEDSNESARMIGNGVTRQDYEIYFSVYPFEPNSMNSDDGGYSASLTQIIDEVRVHFENEIWLVQEMIDLTSNFSFRMEYQGTSKASPLAMEKGLCIGYKHHFSSIAIDNDTTSTTDFMVTDEGVSGEVDFS
jgi:hypothetical protein